MSLNWPNDIKLSQPQIGSFLALWVIGYGAVQALAPMITGEKQAQFPLRISTGMQYSSASLWGLIGGLMVFGAVTSNRVG
ncbi:MAG: hypothetical protein U5L02_08695 [Rheinheimera sp.]|nr:hypothetical protein [Rheinheimera sp.]